jgi:hypothetical protein
MYNIRNRYKLDVSGAKDYDGSKVQTWRSNGTAAQRWSFVYVDSFKKRATGLRKPQYRTNYKWSREYRLYFNRPFKIVTQMRSGRLLTVVGNNIQLKSKNNQASQLWNFNHKT